MDRAGESPREHLFYDRAFAEEQFKEGIRTGRIDARPGETRLQWTRRKALEDTEPWDVKEKRVAALIKSCLPKNYKPPNGKSQSYSSQPPVPGRAGESPREHLFYDRAFAEEQFREDVRTGRTDARPGETRLQWTRRKALEIKKSLPKNYKPPNGKSHSYSSQPPVPVPRQPSLEDIAEEQPECLDTTLESYVTAGEFSDDDDFQDAEEPSRPGSAAWGYDAETLERVLPKWARASQCSPQGPRLVGEDIDHQESTGVSYTKAQDSYPMEEEVGEYAQESYPMEEEVGDYAQFEDELEGLGEYQRHRDILSRTLPSNPMVRDELLFE
ncbi:hypothetical protein GE061_005989 [Apolygus lucorum]|uniref:Uncharacterized protein n=1 Tax=Apolygus lucorum TaxID=248454 RepID=A0A8S9WU79_APOLU|nr:hypothetical protein GE061_005989 [Apolygus lucorum]